MISIGIDLGGTNIAVGVVEETGHIIGRAVRPTGAQRPCEQVIFDMAQTVRDAVENAGKDVRDIHSIGCGVPGIYDEESGMVLFCTSMRRFIATTTRPWPRWPKQRPARA